MKRLTYVLVLLSVMLLGLAFAQNSTNTGGESEDETPAVATDSAQFKVVPFRALEVHDTFPWQAYSEWTTWSDHRFVIEPPLVNMVIWQPLASAEPFPYIVIEGRPDTRVCGAFYDESLEGSITPDVLSRAVASCVDMLLMGRAEGMPNAGSDFDAKLVEAYAAEVLKTCPTLGAYNWANAPGDETCKVPSIRTFGP